MLSYEEWGKLPLLQRDRLVAIIAMGFDPTAPCRGEYTIPDPRGRSELLRCPLCGANGKPDGTWIHFTPASPSYTVSRDTAWPILARMLCFYHLSQMSAMYGNNGRRVLQQFVGALLGHDTTENLNPIGAYFGIEQIAELTADTLCWAALAAFDDLPIKGRSPAELEAMLEVGYFWIRGGLLISREHPADGGSYHFSVATEEENPDGSSVFTVVRRADTLDALLALREMTRADLDEWRWVACLPEPAMAEVE